MSPGDVGPRRARLLVSGAAVAAVMTAALLGLLVAGLGRRAAEVTLFHGLAAAGTAGVAVGLLVLARAAALARSGSLEAASTRYLRCVVAATVVGVAALVTGVTTAVTTRSPLPGWGGALALFLLALLVALALRLRAVTVVARRRPDRGSRRGDGGESEPDGAAGAR